jgi:hypothetical protein
MSLSESIKIALKRGALVTAANWQVVVIQFAADSVFKTLLTVPVIGAAFLIALIVGGSVPDVLASDLRSTVWLALSTLAEHKGALAAYLAGVLVVVIGASVLMFLVKSGSFAVLVDAERHAPVVEQPPLRAEVVREGGRFTLEAFSAGCTMFGRRFVRLGLILIAAYAVTVALYLALIIVSYRWTNTPGLAWLGTIIAAASSLVLVAWITVLNLLYLLAQLITVAANTSVASAMATVPRFVARERRLVGGIFIVVVALVMLATAASVLATAALGFIGFVPVVGLAMLPLQFVAWLCRGLLFEYLGLAALGAYAKVLRGSAGVLRTDGAHAASLNRAPAMGQMT